MLDVTNLPHDLSGKPTARAGRRRRSIARAVTRIPADALDEDDRPSWA